MAFIRYFIGVPRIILNDQTCSSTDKLIYGMINSLSNNKEYCYASNGYFAKELGLTTKTVSKSLSKLKELNYIKIDYSKTGRKIILNPSIVSSENSKVSNKKFQDGMEEKEEYKRKYNTKKINKNKIIIEKDKDGVELWNGKRCESTPMNEETRKERKEFINSFKE